MAVRVLQITEVQFVCSTVLEILISSSCRAFDSLFTSTYCKELQLATCRSAIHEV